MAFTDDRDVISSDNYGPVVNIMTWFLLVALVLGVMARVGTKLGITRRLSIDDAVIAGSMLFSLAQSATVSVQCSNGLGQHASTLTPSQLDVFQRALYASGFLYILSLCLAKLSVLQLLRIITPVQLHVNLSLATGVIIIVWAVTSVFGNAFQCQLPHPWMMIGNKCFDQTAFWSYVAILNILTDAALVLLPVIIVWRVQVSGGRKAIIAGCFASRLTAMGATVAQLIFIQRANNTTDPTFDLWPVLLLTQVIQCLSIITACIPYLKPFLESLESGVTRTDDLRRRGLNGTYGYGTAKDPEYGTAKSTQLTNVSISRVISPGSKKESRGIDFELPEGGNSFGLTETTATANGHEADWDATSQTSRSKIIKTTTTWAVDTESQPSRAPSE